MVIDIFAISKTVLEDYFVGLECIGGGGEGAEADGGESLVAVD